VTPRVVVFLLLVGWTVMGAVLVPFVAQAVVR
jgi:hypothetical protein